MQVAYPRAQVIYRGMLDVLRKRDYYQADSGSTHYVATQPRTGVTVTLVEGNPFDPIEARVGAAKAWSPKSLAVLLRDAETAATAESGTAVEAAALLNLATAAEILGTSHFRSYVVALTRHLAGEEENPPEAVDDAGRGYPFFVTGLALAIARRPQGRSLAPFN